VRIPRPAAALILIAFAASSASAATCDDNPVEGEGFLWDAPQGHASPTYCQNLSSPAAVKDCSVARWNTVNSPNVWEDYGSRTCTNSDAYGCRAYSYPGRYYYMPGHYYQGDFNITVNRPTGVAPDEALCTDPEPECGDGTKGRLQPTRSATASAVATIIGSCLDGCEVASVRVDPIGINKDVDGTFYFLPWVKFSGNTCSGGEPEIPPDDPEPADEPTGEVCKESAEGTEVCGAPAYGENCGYVNGEFVCLGKTDPDECWVNGDGSRLCGDTAPMPPVPDSGTPGQRATPDDTLGAIGPTGTTNNYNYYNSATVAGSSRDAGDSGANPNRNTSTNPSTGAIPVVVEGDGEGTGEGDGGGPFGGPEMDEVGTFGELTQSFVDGLEAAPIVAAWTGIGSSIPAGACPDADISVFGETYSFTDFACGIWDDTVVPLLSLVFLFVWPFMGLRILMSA